MRTARVHTSLVGVLVGTALVATMGVAPLLVSAATTSTSASAATSYTMTSGAPATVPADSLITWHDTLSPITGTITGSEISPTDSWTIPANSGVKQSDISLKYSGTNGIVSFTPDKPGLYQFIVLYTIGTGASATTVTAKETVNAVAGALTATPFTQKNAPAIGVLNMPMALQQTVVTDPSCTLPNLSATVTTDKVPSASSVTAASFTVTSQHVVAFTPDAQGNYVFDVTYTDSCTPAETATATEYVYVPFVVGFDANGGTGTQTPINTDSTGSAVLPANNFVAPTGKSFGGWNTKSDGTGTQYAAASTITGLTTNTLLYAQWTTAANTCSNGRNVVTTQNLRLREGQGMPKQTTDGSVLAGVANGQLVLSNGAKSTAIGNVGNYYWAFQADGNVVQYNATTGAVGYASNTRVGDLVGNYVGVQCANSGNLGNLVVYPGNNSEGTGLVLMTLNS